ncbi:hypothetical protein KVV02_001338 [Mortierella alpina]|uniref:Uncharacterized protein n=1 Tax=Mortierella alpina TaxID=64518 RepID=A0A9P8CXH4_MORAP|nr:hypothetical protein KVV02_001338 [Mortierella alpina]
MDFLASVALGLSLLCGTASAVPIDNKMDFVIAEGIQLSDISHIIQRPDIQGAQVIYNWKSMEPSKGVYNFSSIKKDLAFLNGKKLFVQVQDRFFDPKARNIPQYLLDDPIYEGGLERQEDSEPGAEGGWVTKHWVPAVRQRFQALLLALATQMDGKIYGVNLPETSAGLNLGTELCKRYFDAEMENALYGRSVFKKTTFIQYVNFWPCQSSNGLNYTGRSFEMAIDHGLGLGGPDVRPWQPYQMENSYKFFHEHKNDLKTIAMAVQQPDLRFKNKTTGEPYSMEEFRGFAVDYLGADLIFWTNHIFKDSAPSKK